MPAQTRGFLFSDLRGYSSFTETHGDRAARDLLTTYRRIVRDAIAQFDGAEIRTEGDSFYVVFASVSQAVEAGLAIQGMLAHAGASGQAIPAGIGIHAGEVEDDQQQGIVSNAVNIASRLCSAAPAGDVLVSDTVRSLTRTYLDVSYEHRGRRRLKGIREPVEVYSVTRQARDRRRFGRVRSSWAPGRLVAAVALLAVVGASAIFGGTLIRESLAGQSPTAAATTGAAVATPSRPPPSTPPASQSAEFPTPQEQGLVQLVDEGVQPSCERASDGSIPPMMAPAMAATNFQVMRTDVHFLAGVSCQPFGVGSPDELAYWRLSAPGHDAPAVVSADEWIVNRAGWLEIRGGSCRQDRRALERWDAGPLSGFLLCFSTDTLGSVLYWTYDHSDVMGRAVMGDGDLDALLAWWQRDARYREP